MSVRAPAARSKYGFDPDRHRRVREGIRRILEAPLPCGLPAEYRLENRVDRHLGRLLGSYERCCQRAWYAAYAHDNLQEPGVEYRPTTDPCHARGCERCGRQHAAYELGRWVPAFDAAYPPGEPLAVLVLIAPGLGPRAVRQAMTRLLRRRPIQRVLGPVVGFLHPARDGARVHLIVRRAALRRLKVLLGAWKDLVPGGWLSARTVLSTDALAVAVELRHEAEQAIFMLVADGALDPEQARQWLEEELGADGKPGVNRMVFSPGFRALAGPGRGNNEAGHPVGSAQVTATLPEDRPVGEICTAPASILASGPCQPRPPAVGSEEGVAGAGQPLGTHAGGAMDTPEPCPLGHGNCRVRRIENPARWPWWEIQQLVQAGKARPVPIAGGDEVIYEPATG